MLQRAFYSDSSYSQDYNYTRYVCACHAVRANSKTGSEVDGESVLQVFGFPQLQGSGFSPGEDVTLSLRPISLRLHC